MKKSLFLVLFLLILIGLFVAALFSLDMEKVWTAITSVHVGWMLLYFAIGFFNFSLYVKRWDTIVHAYRKGQERISFWSMMGIRYVTYAVSYLIPSAQVGGEPFRVYFLEERGESRKRAISSVIIDKTFEAAVIVVFSIVAIAVALYYAQVGASEVEHTSSDLITLVGLLTTLGIFSLYFYLTIAKDGFFTTIFRVTKLNKVKVLAPYEEKIMATEALMKRFFKTHVRELGVTIILTLLTYGVFLVETWVLLQALGITATVGQTVLISTLPMVTYLIPIPGAAGALEASQYLALQVAGIPDALTLTVPLIIILRLRDFMFMGCGVFYASKHGLQLLANGNKKDENMF